MPVVVTVGGSRLHTGEQCRQRFYSRPTKKCKKGCWTQEEDYTIVRLQGDHGNCWRKIAKYLPDWSKNCTKNRWHYIIQPTVSIPSVSSKCDVHHPQDDRLQLLTSPCPTGWGRPLQTSCTPYRLCRLFKPFKTTEKKTLVFRSREVGDGMRPIKLKGNLKEHVQYGQNGRIFKFQCLKKVCKHPQKSANGLHTPKQSVHKVCMIFQVQVFA